MAKPAPRSENPIDRLLHERTQYLTWLARLDSTGDAVPSVPDAVRSKIRGDYEARLQTVLEELRSFTTGIQEQLEEYRARRSELSSRESQAKETMSEAEVRHAVGEYDEAKWQNIRGETTRILVSVREELTRTTAEIDRLTEVLGLITAPVPEPEVEEPEPQPIAAPPAASVAARPSAPPAPSAPPVPMLTLEPELSPAPKVSPPPPPVASPTAAELIFKPVAAARPAPKPAPKAKDEAPGRAEWIPSAKVGEGVDELAFLKSVTAEPPAPSPKRASGGFPKAAEPPPAPTPAPAPPAPAAASTPFVTSEPFASKTQVAVPDPGKDRASQGSAPKTLKCGECGTMNRPTEWYCERCGAELAAL